jgi:hypothetical protein
LACTLDACDEAADGCSHSPVDSSCDDGLFCNGTETCSPSIGCRAGAFPCTDGVSCTTDGCDEALDACIHAPADVRCDDGNACNGLESCDPALGFIASTGIDCSPLDSLCATHACDAESGACIATPTNEGGDCEDGNACTVSDTCAAGQCLHVSYCGVPVSRAAQPRATDALFALRATVGLESCPSCECDVNSDGRTSVSDALAILRRALELEIDLRCFAPLADQSR